MKKGTLFFVSLAVFLVVLGFSIQTTVFPAENSRVIVDHTLDVYTSPKCFDQANLTNNLEETTWKAAKEMNYPPESECTMAAFEGVKKSLLVSWFSSR
ncbi:hypothetical protein [Halalkalibacter urbisdiaboli]|uniref:hypothetical protein n=1 Tax=Halalkalibacter urbisdiaboli TaxID=1960589 RepID=UPI000B44E6CD|nr:hypothetical protein [Halalkalibacter urbisdiaboli]